MATFLGGYATRIDGTGPTVTQGEIDACYKTVAEAEAAALAPQDGLRHLVVVVEDSGEAREALARMAGECPEVLVGAGTVLSAQQVDDAHARLRHALQQVRARERRDPADDEEADERQRQPDRRGVALEERPVRGLAAPADPSRPLRQPPRPLVNASAALSIRQSLRLRAQQGLETPVLEVPRG